MSAPATRIVVAVSPGEARAVALDAAGELRDFVLWRPARPDSIGDLYRGRIVRHVRAMGGVFVTLGGGPDGFLPDRDGSKELPEGTLVWVRITRVAQGGKGPRLRLEHEAAASGAAGLKVGLVRHGPNAIVRLAKLWPNAPVAVDDAETGAELALSLPGRVVRGSGFDPMLEAALAALAAPEVQLANGARLTIEPVRALVAIDVDAQAALSAGGDAAPAHRAINEVAIPEVARQIRLRNLSGAILIDLAGESVRARKKLAPLFVAALASDPLQPRLLGFTALGLAEILRPRGSPPLHELLAGSHAAGLHALREGVRESLADPAARLRLRAAPAVIGAIEGDAKAIASFARKTGRALPLLADPSLGQTQWCLERGGPDARLDRTEVLR